MIYSEDKNRNWFSEAEAVREFSGASDVHMASAMNAEWVKKGWRQGRQSVHPGLTGGSVTGQ